QAIGFNRGVNAGADTEAIEKTFSPEFRNRLDAIIPFANLAPEIVRMVVDKFVLQLEAQLADRGVTITLSDGARDWLAERGYDPAFGARPLGRVVQEHVKKPLAEELLFGRLTDGGLVMVDTAKPEKDGHIPGLVVTAAEGDRPSPKASKGSSPKGKAPKRKAKTSAKV
ncbi:MAG: ATP-dependent Clp protease ATP-binding subunit ClpA, partial [Alphaproteobacteria bacterium]|nr:ATP-dependent Clp protease ATP-binding subunit ClpA [Alphaproteobacteria bacterium]